MIYISLAAKPGESRKDKDEGNFINTVGTFLVLMTALESSLGAHSQWPIVEKVTRAKCTNDKPLWC